MKTHLTTRSRFCLCGNIVIGSVLCLASCGTDRDTLPKLPFGGINTILGQRVIKDTTDVTGWALSEDGIELVSIYIDRVFIANSEIGLPRPDVATTYPKVPNSTNSGWFATIEPTRLSPGWHELTIQA